MPRKDIRMRGRVKGTKGEILHGRAIRSLQPEFNLKGTERQGDYPTDGYLVGPIYACQISGLSHWTV